MKRNFLICYILIHLGIVLQSGYGDSAGNSKGSEPSIQTSPGQTLSSKIEELHEKSDALIAAISAKIEAMIAKARSSRKTGSCFLKINCNQAEFDRLVGNNITVLSVDDFNKKTAQGSSLSTPPWWIPTTEMSTNFMTSKNFQQVVDKGHAFALYDQKEATALFYFNWKEVAEE